MNCVLLSHKVNENLLQQQKKINPSAYLIYFSSNKI
jgi:hypothetical protein